MSMATALCIGQGPNVATLVSQENGITSGQGSAWLVGSASCFPFPVPLPPSDILLLLSPVLHISLGFHDNILTGLQ